LVYRYFGSSKKSILLEALKVFIEDHYAFTGKDKELSVAERIKRARARMVEYPEAVLFYQKWRSKESWLKGEFVKAERRYQKTLSKRFPEMSPEKITMMHAFFHGVVTAPFITPDEAYWACREFEKVF
jgi:hypothetical protein